MKCEIVFYFFYPLFFRANSVSCGWVLPKFSTHFDCAVRLEAIKTFVTRHVRFMDFGS